MFTRASVCGATFRRRLVVEVRKDGISTRLSSERRCQGPGGGAACPECKEARDSGSRVERVELLVETLIRADMSIAEARAFIGDRREARGKWVRPRTYRDSESEMHISDGHWSHMTPELSKSLKEFGSKFCRLVKSRNDLSTDLGKACKMVNSYRFSHFAADVFNQIEESV